MSGWMGIWMGGWVDGWMDGWMGGWVDWRVDGWMDGWVGGWVDGWMDVVHTTHIMSQSSRYIYPHSNTSPSNRSKFTYTIVSNTYTY